VRLAASAPIGSVNGERIVNLTAGLAAQEVTLVGAVTQAPLPKVFVNDLQALEGDGSNGPITPFTFQVKLQKPAATAVTFDVFTQDGPATPLIGSAVAGVNYVGISSGTVTFQSGQAYATVTVNVKVGSFAPAAGSVYKQFTVNLSDPLNPTVPLAVGTGLIAAQLAQVHSPSTSHLQFAVEKSTETAGGVHIRHLPQPHGVKLTRPAKDRLLGLMQDREDVVPLGTEAPGDDLRPAHPGVAAHASSFSTTRPCTSVRRKSRPW
jgi:hypothetical protein